MLTFFDEDVSEFYDKLLDSVIRNKLDTCSEACSVNTQDINDILGDFQNKVNYTLVAKPKKKINWKKEPIIKPQMNRAFILRKQSIEQAL